jgi:hypothetical protein
MVYIYSKLCSGVLGGVKQREVCVQLACCNSDDAIDNRELEVKEKSYLLHHLLPQQSCHRHGSDWMRPCFVKIYS